MTRRRYLLWVAVVLTLFWARFFTCVEALDREPRSLADPVASVDPHGFGLFGAFMIAAVQTIPFCWLLLGGRPTTLDAPVRATAAQAIAVVAVIGSPTLVQLSYIRGLPAAVSAPVMISALGWLVLVAGLTAHQRPGLPSPHRAFAARPKLAWAIVAATGLPVLIMLTN